MSKLSCVISCPVDVYGGYPARSRDILKAFINTQPGWDVRVLPQRWGMLRKGFLEDHQEWDLQSRILPNLQKKPNIWGMVTIPSEFSKQGDFNIGITAGIETTLCDASWIEGCNRMDLVLVSSQHAKTVFENSQFDIIDKATGNTVKQLKLTTPVEVLFEGIDLEKYFPKDMPGKNFKRTEISRELDKIPEDFLFLCSGMFMQGAYGHDRKNIGYTIKSFLEAFKHEKNPPALLLKTSQSTSSIIDQEQILNRIDVIRGMVKGENLPNIYLFHGDILDSEINELYNHDKVKAMVSLTKGEGFGRPLLEFTVTGKPVIASGWSGQVDFLDKDLSLLVGGTLENVHPSAVTEKMILAESKWFKPDDMQVGTAYKSVVQNYNKHKAGAKKQGQRTRKEFSMQAMENKLSALISEYLPPIAVEQPLVLPQIKLPGLKKITT